MHRRASAGSVRYRSRKMFELGGRIRSRSAITFTMLFVTLWFWNGATNSDGDGHVRHIIPELNIGRLNTSSVRVGIFVQVGDWTLWDELASDCIDHVFQAARVEFVIVSSHQSGQEARVRLRYPSADVIIVPNFGADIGAFFIQLAAKRETIRAATYVLKVHTKTRDWWRRGMLRPICGGLESVQRALTSLQLSPRVGILGALDFVFFLDGNDEAMIKQLAPSYGVSTSFYNLYDIASRSMKFERKVYRNWKANFDLLHLQNKELLEHFRQNGLKERRVFNRRQVENLELAAYPRFVAGTCAWFRVSPLADFLSQYMPEQIAMTLIGEVNYFQDAAIDRVTHSWERTLSLVMRERGYSTAGI